MIVIRERLLPCLVKVCSHENINLLFNFFHLFFSDTSTEFADCRTGEVRFRDFSDNSEEDSRQGTIQICVNKAWGSVCGDHFFDNTDAVVFCGVLDGFKPIGRDYLSCQLCFHFLFLRSNCGRVY